MCGGSQPGMVSRSSPSDPGSHPVFATGAGSFVKLCSSHWPHDGAHERLACRLLEPVPSTVVPRPPVLTWGALYRTCRRWPWPCLLVGAPPGRSVWDIRRRLSLADRMALAQALGRVVRVVHGIGSGDVAALLARRWLALNLRGWRRIAGLDVGVSTGTRPDPLRKRAQAQKVFRGVLSAQGTCG
jgi:hypothetical protein